jgi:hypothetical protein
MVAAAVWISTPAIKFRINSLLGQLPNLAQEQQAGGGAWLLVVDIASTTTTARIGSL